MRLVELSQGEGVFKLETSLRSKGHKPDGLQIERQDVKANDDLNLLQLGMTLAADIILEDRKIWEWVFELIFGPIR